jgi:hypothetical protein
MLMPIVVGRAELMVQFERGNEWREPDQTHGQRGDENE